MSCLSLVTTITAVNKLEVVIVRLLVSILGVADGAMDQQDVSTIEEEEPGWVGLGEPGEATEEEEDTDTIRLIT